ncbi:MAG: DNA-3-methyladenine glycosylase [Chthoniobacterales bacterium]
MSGRRADTLDAAFFSGDVLQCARDLIGAELVWGRCGGIVVECEAYLTENDEASHCFSRPSTRAFVARNAPGAAYIYLNYGVHWMLNVLVKGGALDGLILIRAVEPTRGVPLMQSRRGAENVRQLCSGPGKLTQAFDINMRHHEMDLTADPKHCFVVRPDAAVEVVADERIGITRSADLPWRFTQLGSGFVSRPVRAK